MANPFTRYVTAEKMPSKLLSEWFSQEILNGNNGTSVRTVTDPVSQFVIGTPGSGKTMLLRMLTFTVQREMFATDQDALIPIGREFLGENKNYLGVYFTFDEDRIDRYDDGRLDETASENALSDFIGTKIALEILDSLSDDRISRLGGSNLTQAGRDQAAAAVGKTLQSHGVDASFDTWSKLLEWFQERLKSHHRFASQCKDRPVEGSQLKTTTAPMAIFDAATNAGLLAPNSSLYIILDQADRVLGRKVVSYVLKRTIVDATRSRQSSVHLKVGLRRRSVVELGMSSTELSIDREMQHIDIDMLDRRDDMSYELLLRDICRKRLKSDSQLLGNLAPHSSETLNEPSSEMDVITTALAELTAEEEAQQLVKDRQDRNKHIKHFCEAWQKLGMDKKVAEEISNDVMNVNGLIDQMLVLINLSKSIKRQVKQDPRLVSTYAETFDLVKQEQSRRIRTKWTDLALFQLINIYGRSRKSYAGFSVLARCSERSVSHFLEVLGTIVDQAARDDNGKIVLPISVQTQTSVVHNMSSHAWINMQDLSPQGARIARLLRKVSLDYQKLLNLTWLPRACFCAFDLVTDPGDIIRNALREDEYEPPSYSEKVLGLALREALAAGYLRSETKEGGNRFRLWINRTFLPHLELPFQSQQEASRVDEEYLLNFFSKNILEEKGRPILADRVLTDPQEKLDTGQLAFLNPA